MEKKKREDKRTKNWTFVIYPTECFDNWQNLINEQHIEWVESPLHDKDLNDDNTPKKAHKHILLMFSSNKSYHQVFEFLQTLGETVTTVNNTQAIKGVAIPQECRNVKGMIRYFAHVDNPEKYQYDPKDVIGHCGFNVSSYFELNYDVDDVECDIEEYIDEHGIIEYKALVQATRQLKTVHPEWHKCVSTHTIHFKAYINSARYTTKPKEQTKEQREEIEQLAEESLKVGGNDENS